MLKDRVVLLSSPEAVTEFLDRYPSSVIFKAGTCHKTMQGFGFVQEKLDPREDLMCGVIRVVEARPASNLVTEITGIQHESPQVIVFHEREPVFNVDNWGITPEAIELGFQRVPVGPALSGEAGGAGSDVRTYVELLESFLAGRMTEEQFEHTYTHTFRADSTLRPGEEVDILNSIFGDVDQHINMHMMMEGKSDTSQLRGRAQDAYRRLMALQASA